MEEKLESIDCRMDDRLCMRKYYENTSTTTDNVAITVPEVFHIPRPSLATQNNLNTINSRESEQNPQCVSALYFSENAVQKRCFYTPKNVASNIKSGFRNKQTFLPVNSQTAILLPRPETANNFQVNEKTQIQRIPVFNHTQFQFQPNAQSGVTAMPSEYNNNNTDQSRFVITNEKRTVSSVPTENASGLDILGRNNNSRVRNAPGNETRKRKLTQNPKNKTSEHVDKCDNEKASDEDKAVKRIDYINTCTEISKPQLHSKEVDSYIKRGNNDGFGLPQSDNLECHGNLETVSERESDSSSTASNNDKEMYSEILHTTDSVTNLPATSEIKRSRQEQKVLNKVKSLLKQKVKVKKSTTAVPKTTHDNAEKDKEITARLDDHLTDTINRVASGEAFITDSSTDVTEKEQNLETTTCTASEASTKGVGKVNKKQNNVDGKLQNDLQLSKTSRMTQLDIEARYLGHKLNCCKDMFGNTDSVINKVESDRLSMTNDHHLLKLSEEEREFLRNKCYLENGLITDLRQRLERQSETQTSTSVDKPLSEGCALEETSQHLPKEGNWLMETKDITNIDIDKHTEFSISVSEENDISKKTKGNQTKDVTKESQRSARDKQSRDLNVVIKQPVIKLHRLDSILPDKNDERKVSTAESQQESTSTSKRIFYVINSNDILKIPQQTGGEKTSSKHTQLKHLHLTSQSPKFQMMKTVIPSTQASNSSINTASEVVDAKSSRETGTVSGSKAGVSNNHLPTIIIATPKTSLSTSRSCENISTSMNSNPIKYSNKVTVKELLQEKRENNTSGFSLRDGMKDHHIKQVQPFATAVDESKMKYYTNIQSTYLTNQCNPVSSNSAQEHLGKKSSILITHQLLNQGKINQQLVNVNPILKPKATPVSTLQQYTIKSPPSVTSRVDTKLDRVLSTHIASVSGTSTTEFQTASEVRKQVFIKMGDQTVVVKRNESKVKEVRRTLPAPKPKHSVANDYKRKRKRPRMKNKRTSKTDHTTLRTKLRMLLNSSNDSVKALLHTLDLIPVKLLKELVDTEKSTGRALNDTSFTASEDETHVSEIKQLLPNSMEKNRKRRYSDNSRTNITNVMIISKDKTGNVKYNIHQTKVKYTYETLDACQTFCRLKFSDGKLEKMHTGNLKRGLYLVQNCKYNAIDSIGNKTLGVLLVLYPPYIATVPDDSLCIAVGDAFTKGEETQHMFYPVSINAQDVLTQFLGQGIERTMYDFTDKRYCSITDKSMSPRYSSPMFYSSKMKNAFDVDTTSSNYFDSLRFDSAASDYKRSDTAASTGVKTVRFSERGMALKIKQNELFESCSKLKTERKEKEYSRRKREITIKHEIAKVSTTGCELECEEEDVRPERELYTSPSDTCADLNVEELEEHIGNKFDVCVD